MPPQLLVSVRDQVEAQAALSGGCDVLDIKEPRAGALGRTTWDVMAEVTRVARAQSPQCHLSAALGELSEWTNATSSPTTNQRAACSRLSYVKLGLAQMSGRQNLAQQFAAVATNINRAASPLMQWVAVMYADWHQAKSPTPRDVLTLIDTLQATCGIQFGGLLVDTFTKGEQRLFDFVSPTELSDWRQAAHARGLLFAIAGRLRTSDLPQALAIKPDIVAVRSAVCGSGDRMNAVTEVAVREFHAALRQ